MNWSGKKQNPQGSMSSKIVISSLTNDEFLNANGINHLLRNMFYGFLTSGKVTLLVDSALPLDIYEGNSAILNVLDYLKSQSSLEIKARRSIIPYKYRPAYEPISADDFTDIEKIKYDIPEDPEDSVIISNHIERMFCEDIPQYSVINISDYYSDNILKMDSKDLISEIKEDRDIFYDEITYQASRKLGIDEENVASLVLADILSTLKLNSDLLCPHEYMSELYTGISAFKNYSHKSSSINTLFSLEGIRVPENLSLPDFEFLVSDQKVDSFRRFIQEIADNRDRQNAGKALVERYRSIQRRQNNTGRKLTVEILAAVITSPLSLLNPIWAFGSAIPLTVAVKEILDRIISSDEIENPIIFLHKMNRRYPEKY